MRLRDNCAIDIMTVLEMPGGPVIFIRVSDLDCKCRLAVCLTLGQAREFAKHLAKTADDLESKKIMKSLPSVRFVF